MSFVQRRLHAPQNVVKAAQETTTRVSSDTFFGRYRQRSNPLEVSMKTQGVINPLGEIIAHDVTFEPNVNVYDRTLQDGIERVIRIECPRVQQEDIDWEARHS